MSESEQKDKGFSENCEQERLDFCGKEKEQNRSPAFMRALDAVSRMLGKGAKK